MCIATVSCTVHRGIFELHFKIKMYSHLSCVIPWSAPPWRCFNECRNMSQKVKCKIMCVCVCVCIYIYTGCNRRKGQNFGRVFLMLKYTDNPKHLYPKLNGYGDNGQRKVWSSGGSTHCTCQLTSLTDVCPWVGCRIQLTLAVQLCSTLIPECAVSHVASCLPCMCHV